MIKNGTETVFEGIKIMNFPKLKKKKNNLDTLAHQMPCMRKSNLGTLQTNILKKKKKTIRRATQKDTCLKKCNYNAEESQREIMETRDNRVTFKVLK